MTTCTTSRTGTRTRTATEGRQPLAALLVASLVLVGLPPAAQAGAAERASAVLQTTLDAAVVVLQDDTLTLDQKRAGLEALADERFDFAVIARLVVARDWRKFSDCCECPLDLNLFSRRPKPVSLKR